MTKQEPGAPAERVIVELDEEAFAVDNEPAGPAKGTGQIPKSRDLDPIKSTMFTVNYTNAHGDDLVGSRLARRLFEHLGKYSLHLLRIEFEAQSNQLKSPD